MKKATLILGALALVLGLSQCRKPNAPAINGGNGETIVQQATVGATCNGGNSKVDGQIIGNALKLTWEQPDVIEVAIYDGSVKSELTLSGPAGGTSGKFTGTITGQTGDKLTFFYKAANSHIFLDEDGGVSTDSENQFGNQNGKLEKTEDKNSILDRLCAYAQNIDFISSSAAEYNVDLEVPYAILKLDLSYFGTAEGTKVTISTGSPTKQDPSVTGITTNSKEVYVAMSAADSYEYTFSGNGKTAKVTWKLDENTYYTKTDGQGGSTGEAIVVAPETPKFSVSATKTVEFSKGNLWYGTASSKDAPAFHFEANQWDFANTWNPNHISHFYWSKSSAEAVKQDYEETGTTASDVFFATSEFPVEGKKWFTLTNDEWNHLLGYDPNLHQQTSTYGRTNAKELCKYVKLTVESKGDVYGLVILPDGDAPSTVIPVTINEAYLTSNNAVFLPVAGSRYGTNMYDVGLSGFYLSSTPSGSNYAYYMFFNSSSVYPNDYYRNTGRCVRLVR